MKNWTILVGSAEKGGKVFDFMRANHIHFDLSHRNGIAKFVYEGTDEDHAAVLNCARS